MVSEFISLAEIVEERVHRFEELEDQVILLFLFLHQLYNKLSQSIKLEAGLTIDLWMKNIIKYGIIINLIYWANSSLVYQIFTQISMSFLQNDS